jgi:hypothetical protein
VCWLALVLHHFEHEVGDLQAVVAHQLAHVACKPLRATARVPGHARGERPTDHPRRRRIDAVLSDLHA